MQPKINKERNLKKKVSEDNPQNGRKYLQIMYLMRNPVRYHFTSTKIAITKRELTTVGKDRKKLELSYTAGRIVKWYSYFGKWFGSASNVNTQSYPMTQKFYSYILAQKNEHIMFTQKLIHKSS